MITIKKEKDLEKMRVAGQIMIEVFDLLENVIKPGISTKDLDKFVHEYIISKGGKPSCLHYGGFPASICTSVDDTIIHGIPRKDEILQEGQIISIDFCVNYKGFNADAARTYPVGKISPEKQRLIDITRQSFFEGIKNIKNGSYVGDISHAVQKFVEKNGYSVIREFVGHGIGSHIHEDPSVPNYGMAGSGTKLKSGMTIAIEPMVNMGKKDIIMEGMWDVKTKDRLPAAHYENTVLITENGVEILTLRG